MTYDERQFLDLLLEYKSDETKKARRNISLIAFVIIALRVLDIPITKTSVFGVPIAGSAELPVLLLASGLLVYWIVMFLLTWTQDNEVQKERSIILKSQIKAFTERFENLEKEDKIAREWSPDYNSVKAAVNAYQAQHNRTGRAAWYGSVIGRIELVVPIALSFAASLVLIRWVLDAL